ncbi:MAG: glycosyltransferase family 4 protein [Polyangiaceae bacterium]
MKRVLFIVASDWYFWCHWMGIAKCVKAAGYDVYVTTPAGKYVKLIEAEGLKHIATPMDRQGRNPLNDVRSLAALVKIMRELKPALVHTVAIKPILYGSLAAKLTGVPAVVHAMPGMGYVFVNDQLLARVLRHGVAAGFKLAFAGAGTRVIIQNPDNLETWIERGVVKRERTAVIRGVGIDTSRFAPTEEPSGPPLVILPARLLYDKGVAEYVESARILKKRGVAARFALVGVGDPGNPASVPPEDTKRWEREGTVELFGWRDDMPEVLAEAAIVCLPSYGEGLPTALLEAASCGKPLVATDVFGCREVVHDGKNGFLVPAKDAKALAGALEKLIVDPSLRKRMGAEGRKLVVDEFSLEIVGKRTLAVYDQILS